MQTSWILPTTSSKLRTKRHVLLLLTVFVWSQLSASAQQKKWPDAKSDARSEAQIKGNAFRPGPTPPVPLILDSGSGRSCVGFTHLTKNSFIWKWTYATCRADGWTVVDRGAQSWTLKLKQTPAEVKACKGVKFVTFEPTYPDNPRSEWNVIGSQFKGQNEDDAPIACGSVI